MTVEDINYRTVNRMLDVTTRTAPVPRVQGSTEFDLIQHLWRCDICEFKFTSGWEGPARQNPGVWKFCEWGSTLYAKVVKLRGIHAQAGSPGHRHSRQDQGARAG